MCTPRRGPADLQNPEVILVEYGKENEEREIEEVYEASGQTKDGTTKPANVELLASCGEPKRFHKTLSARENLA